LIDRAPGGESIRGGSPRCQTIPGAGIDAAIGQLLLDTVTPLALEVALTVQAELEARADEADALRRSHVERARHRADLARRRYWPSTLQPAGGRQPRQAIGTTLCDRSRPPTTTSELRAAARAALDDEHKVRIRSLAADFPVLWADPATPQRERKRMARLLLDDVTLVKDDGTIHVHVRFRSGQIASQPTHSRRWPGRHVRPNPSPPRPAPG